MKKNIICVLSIAALVLAGCIIQPAPSNTNMGKQRVIVVQVCDPISASRPAQIAIYAPTIQGPGQGYKPPHRTISNQGLFELYHTHARAFGVRPITDDSIESSKYYIYRIRSTLTSEWTNWMPPEQIESSFPKEVNYRFSRGNLDSVSLQVAPKLRYRLERYKEFYYAHTSDETRYSDIPGCD